MDVLYFRDAPSKSVVVLLVQVACTVRIFPPVGLRDAPSELGRAPAQLGAVSSHPLWIREGANGPRFANSRTVPRLRVTPKGRDACRILGGVTMS